MASIAFLYRFCQWTREKRKRPEKATLNGDRKGRDAMRPRLFSCFSGPLSPRRATHGLAASMGAKRAANASAVRVVLA
jgi:hypothetical protein